jgi:hypothetical protein
MTINNVQQNDTKKIRLISPKGLLHKANIAKSALGFLAANQEYMRTGELSSVLTPILDQVDAGDILPTPALSLIAEATINHITAVEQRKLLEAKERGFAPQKSSANWVATIYDSKDQVATRIKENGETEELMKGFDKAGDADRWMDRHLSSSEVESGSYGKIAHSHSSVVSLVNRDDALMRFFKAGKSPIMKVQGKSSGSLTNKMRVKADRSTFSAG